MLISYGDLSDAKLLQTYGKLPFKGASAAVMPGNMCFRSTFAVSEIKCLLCLRGDHAEACLLDTQSVLGHAE